MPHVTDKLYHMMRKLVSREHHRHAACHWSTWSHDEETVVSREDHRHAACPWQSLSHDEETVVSREHHRHAACHWQTLLHDEESVVSREHHRHAACHWSTLSHDVVSSKRKHLPWAWFKLTMIGTCCMDSCTSNYHTIAKPTTSLKL
jgi:hypothetical protein